MHIRRYHEDDGKEKAAVHKASIRGIAAQDYAADQIAAWSDIEHDQDADEPDTVRYVAVEDGAIIGFSDYNTETCELSGLYVHPDCTGKGVATELLEAVEDDAREAGLERLWCNSSITAKGFYETHGWSVLEETIHEIDDQELTVYRMEKNL